MKHAFSRLITFINHLFANVVSTFVERWLRKNVTGYVIYRDDEIISYNHVGAQCIMVDDLTGKISLSAKEVYRDAKSNCVLDPSRNEAVQPGEGGRNTTDE